MTTGRTYRNAIQELVLDPLDLESHTFDTNVVTAGDYAHPHSTSPDGVVEEPTPLAAFEALEMPPQRSAAFRVGKEPYLPGRQREAR